MSTSAESLSATSGTQEPLPLTGLDGLPLSIANDAESLAAYQRGIDRANEIFAHPETQQLPLPTSPVAVVRPAERRVPQDFIDQKAALAGKADMRPKPLSQRQIINQRQAERDAAKYGNGAV